MIDILSTESLISAFPLIMKFHNDHYQRFYLAKGSESKHQAWHGGYNDHITQCLSIAEYLWHTGLIRYNKNSIDFDWPDVVYVLYFHDVEKMYKYVTTPLNICPNGIPDCNDKDRYLYRDLFERYSIVFSDKQKNALKYIHGEGSDYCENRVMNGLAAFCHCCDTMSARIFYDKVHLFQDR